MRNGRQSEWPFSGVPLFGCTSWLCVSTWALYAPSHSLAGHAPWLGLSNPPVDPLLLCLSAGSPFLLRGCPSIGQSCHGQRHLRGWCAPFSCTPSLWRLNQTLSHVGGRCLIGFQGWWWAMGGLGFFDCCSQLLADTHGSHF